ncbi:MAG: F0F1 ATP synthase subunit A [Candidatus Nanopelagicales bacterium]
MSDDEGEGFHAPTIEEFFPPQVFGEGTAWGPTRINLIGIVMTIVLCVFFVLAFKRPTMVPGKLQNLGEMAVDLVHTNIIDEVMGVKGRRFAPLMLTLFFMILAFNITGIIPLMNIAVTSVIGVPLVLALISYAVFNWAGIKENGIGRYLKTNLFPAGVPAPIYVLVTPIEFISTFILRPVTLTIRLLANMMSGHLLLALFFGATSYFLFEVQGALKTVAVASFAMGFIFTLFEVVVALLQAYIFTLLTAVYIEGATSHEH